MAGLLSRVAGEPPWQQSAPADDYKSIMTCDLHILQGEVVVNLNCKLNNKINLKSQRPPKQASPKLLGFNDIPMLKKRNAYSPLLSTKPH